MSRPAMKRRIVGLGMALSAVIALTACGNSQEQEQEVPPTSETTNSEPPASSSSETSSESSSATSTVTDEETKALAEVSEHFSTLAPASFFDKLDSCVATGISGSFDCSSAEIGQFQFFDSESKATSTTQLLTELRSSKIVEDDGTRVVGWSTLGTSAIITVVDNEKGQVMQQLVSSDQEDPRKRIYKLGLAEQPEEEETTETEATTEASTEPSQG